MNIYDEAISDLFVVMNEITQDENDVDGLSIYKIVDKLKGIKQALERAKKVEELLTYQNHYIDSIVIELDRITNKAKASQIEIIKKELEGELK